jgi:hypothetical protein
LHTWWDFHRRARKGISTSPSAFLTKAFSPLFLNRLKETAKEAQFVPAPATGTSPGPRAEGSLVDKMGVGDGQEGEGGVNASEDPKIVREPWMQTGLALLGKPVNTPISDLVDSDFILPERCRERLSTLGKVI